jgi:hypothetical protein
MESANMSRISLKMGSRISVPPRSKRPGHKRHNRTGRHYWIAKQVVSNTMAYPDQCIALPVGANDEEIDRLCQDYTASLFAWIDEQKKPKAEEIGTRTILQPAASIRSIRIRVSTR